jgi:hypothetical protein
MHADVHAYGAPSVRGLWTERQLLNQIGNGCPQAVGRRGVVVVRDVGRKPREIALDGRNGDAQPRTFRIWNGISRVIH